MKNNLFPVGSFIYFEGNINVLNNVKFWFAEVIVTSKNNLFAPYLQIRYNNRNCSAIRNF